MTEIANIFDIQGFSVHDGPGSRTVVFLNGCTLNCNWCANPEGRFAYPVPLYNSSKCNFDSACVNVCPNKAISIQSKLLFIDREKCLDCREYLCAEECCSGALRIAGYKKSLDEVFKIIQRDRQYWGADGGITLTGGEPFFQSEFTHELLKRCYSSYIHTAVETCGNVPWEHIENSLAYLDWMFFDIKHLSSKKHAEGTGYENKLILENIRRISADFCGRLIFRMTVIPDYNDSEQHVAELAGFLNALPGKTKEINLLPIHHLAKEKYKMLDLEYFDESLRTVSNKKMKSLKIVLKSKGIECYIGDDTPF
jgi:pyruvate formate lyase activating enzyme